MRTTIIKPILRALASATLAAAFSASAADIDLRFDFLDSHSMGNRMTGLARVEVRNLTGGVIHDVDVTLAHAGVDSIEKGLIQFGSVPAGKARTMTRRLSLSTAADHPLLWRVQYRQGGARKEAVLLGEQIVLGRGIK